MRPTIFHLILAALLPHVAAAQSVVINEIGWMGTRASASDEWIELCNTTSLPIDLGGWSLNSADGSPAIRLTGAIPPLGFYVLERTDEQTISDRAADQLFTGDLKNSGEHLLLRDKDSLLIDQVRCDSTGWFAGSNAPKRSMEKKHPLLNGNAASSWASCDSLNICGMDAGGNPILGSPGRVNSVFDNTLPVEIGKRMGPAATSPGGMLMTGYPNPFNPGITLEWQQPAGETAIEIIDLLGRIVRAWPFPPSASPGKQRLYWDGCDAAGQPVATGAYFCLLRRERGIAASMLLMRCR